MPVKEVLKMGHPVLRDKAQEVAEFNTSALASLLEDMQIGVSLRVVIFAVESNPRYPDVEPIPQTILINPEIFPLSPAQESGWEGCLSLPGMRGLVPRYQHIRYRGYDRYGELIEREVHGFHARVVQHEVDHLDGILYPLRMTDMTQFGFEQEHFPPV